MISTSPCQKLSLTGALPTERLEDLVTLLRSFAYESPNPIQKQFYVLTAPPGKALDLRVMHDMFADEWYFVHESQPHSNSLPVMTNSTQTIPVSNNILRAISHLGYRSEWDYCWDGFEFRSLSNVAISVFAVKQLNSKQDINSGVLFQDSKYSSPLSTGASFSNPSIAPSASSSSSSASSSLAMDGSSSNASRTASTSLLPSIPAVPRFYYVEIATYSSLSTIDEKITFNVANELLSLSAQLSPHVELLKTEYKELLKLKDIGRQKMSTATKPATATTSTSTTTQTISSSTTGRRSSKSSAVSSTTASQASAPSGPILTPFQPTNNMNLTLVPMNYSGAAAPAYISTTSLQNTALQSGAQTAFPASNVYHSNPNQ